MTFSARFASPLLVAASLLWLAALSVASAQDVMELDLAFKNGQLQRNATEERQAGSVLQGQRHRRDAQGKDQGRTEANKRYVRRSRDSGASRSDCIVLRKERAHIFDEVARNAGRGIGGFGAFMQPSRLPCRH